MGVFIRNLDVLYVKAILQLLALAMYFWYILVHPPSCINSICAHRMGHSKQKESNFLGISRIGIRVAYMGQNTKEKLLSISSRAQYPKLRGWSCRLRAPSPRSFLRGLER